MILECERQPLDFQRGHDAAEDAAHQHITFDLAADQQIDDFQVATRQAFILGVYRRGDASASGCTDLVPQINEKGVDVAVLGEIVILPD